MHWDSAVPWATQIKLPLHVTLRQTGGKAITHLALLVVESRTYPGAHTHLPSLQMVFGLVEQSTLAHLVSVISHLGPVDPGLHTQYGGFMLFGSTRQSAEEFGHQQPKEPVDSSLQQSGRVQSTPP